MKNLILILALFIGLGAMAQTPYIYKLHSDNPIEIFDSTMFVVTVSPEIIEWKQNFFGSDSTAVYEEGYFYDVLTKVEKPELNQYIIDPYPTEFHHCFVGLNETNAIFKRKE